MASTQDTNFAYTQLYANEFVTCAGSILFRYEPVRDIPLHVAILHNQKNGEYVLPKGRQDCGEALARTALRETYEETGNTCELLPVKMITRATPPGRDVVDAPRHVNNCTEPFAVTVRKARTGSTKFIWWYITTCTSLSSSRYSPPPPRGTKKRTQTASEDFKVEWCELEAGYDLDGVETDEELDCRKASAISDAAHAIAAKLTFEEDRELLTKAIELVGQTYPGWFFGNF